MIRVGCGMEGIVLLLFFVCNRPVIYYCWLVGVRYNRQDNDKGWMWNGRSVLLFSICKRPVVYYC